MSNVTNELESFLAIVGKAEDLLAEERSLEDVCKALDIQQDFLSNFVNRCSMPPNSGDSLSTSSLLDAVVPIFAEENSNSVPQQVGSGVLLKIGNELFVLTAAHVMDFCEGDGALLMPSSEGIVPMHGSVSYTPVPEGCNRSSDKADLAYFHLDNEWQTTLHPDFVPLGVDDLLLTDSLLPGELFTFVGYPWRNTKKKGLVHEGDRTTYTGHSFSADVYEQLGYDHFAHILIRLRRRKTVSSRYGGRNAAVHPEGISGGAVLAWPRTMKERQENPQLKLAAICHTYHSKSHCMASTRVISFIMAILKNNPDLAVHFADTEHASSIFFEYLEEIGYPSRKRLVPALVGISWYTPGTYLQCLDIFDDRSSLPDSFRDWVLLALDLEVKISASGAEVFRVHIDPDEFPKWCVKNGFQRVDEHARVEFANMMVSSGI